MKNRATCTTGKFNLHLHSTFCSKTDCETFLDWPLKCTQHGTMQQNATCLVTVSRHQTAVSTFIANFYVHVYRMKTVT